jgi:hypothetical protein
MNVGFWKKKILTSAHNVSISHQIQIVVFATDLIHALEQHPLLVNQPHASITLIQDVPIQLCI